MHEATTTTAKPLVPLPTAPSPESKSSIVSKMLKRPKGATLSELMSATAWQAHSVRAFLSGLRKKGHVLVKEQRKSGEQIYRFASPAKGV